MLNFFTASLKTTTFWCDLSLWSFLQKKIMALGGKKNNVSFGEICACSSVKWSAARRGRPVD